uniref:Uncharacterized protein n=1 Tax=Proboscia inermis TaxID=420281 RepID=A0A7S0BXQ2_9STRA
MEGRGWDNHFTAVIIGILNSPNLAIEKLSFRSRPTIALVMNFLLPPLSRTIRNTNAGMLINPRSCRVTKSGGFAQNYSTQYTIFDTTKEIFWCFNDHTPGIIQNIIALERII